MKNELMQRLRLKYPPPDGYCRWGRIQDVSATLLNAWLPGVFMGELCCIKPGEELAEVVGIRQQSFAISFYEYYRASLRAASDGLKATPSGSRGRSVIRASH